MANVAMIFGMVMFGVLVATVGNALARATSDAHEVRRGMHRVHGDA